MFNSNLTSSVIACSILLCSACLPASALASTNSSGDKLAANSNITKHAKIIAAPSHRKLAKQAIAQLPSTKDQLQEKKTIGSLDEMSMQLKLATMQLQLNQAKINLYQSKQKLAKLTNVPLGNQARAADPLSSIKLNLIYKKANKPVAQISLFGQSFELKQGDKIPGFGLEVKQLTADNITIDNPANGQIRNISLNGYLEQI